MAVGERESASLVVVAGRDIDDVEARTLIRISVHIDHEHAVVHGIFALIEENEGVRRSWVDHVCHFPVDAPRFRGGPTDGQVLAAAAYPNEGGHGADTRKALATDVDETLVRRAFVDFRSASVFVEDAFCDVGVDIPIFPIVGIEIEPATDPFVWPVFHMGKAIIVILDIHPPAERKLTMIVHAGYALSFGFRFGKGWKEHAGEDRDDGDDDEELNECKASFGIARNCFHKH